MDKLITLNCTYIGSSILDKRIDTQFSIQVTDSEMGNISPSTAWSNVTKYVESKVPLSEANLTSTVIKEVFSDSSKNLDILVPSSSKSFKITYTDPSIPTQTISVSGSIN